MLIKHLPVDRSSIDPVPIPYDPGTNTGSIHDWWIVAQPETNLSAPYEILSNPLFPDCTVFFLIDFPLDFLRFKLKIGLLHNQIQCSRFHQFTKKSIWIDLMLLLQKLNQLLRYFVYSACKK